jgi:hypothetical protein
MGDEATGSRWSRNIDIAAKLLLPVALFGGSAIIGWSQQREAKFRACVDQQFKLAEFACDGEECAAKTEGRVLHLTGLTDSVGKLCKAVGIEIADATRDAVQTSAAASNNVARTAEAAKTAGIAPAKIAQSTDTNMSLAQRTTTIAPPASGVAAGGAPQPMVYVQISNASQRDAATALIARLNTAEFVGTTLKADGPDLQPGRASRTELRCLKEASCGQAPALATYLQAILGEPVTVVDLRKRYGSNPAIRPWTYELWLGPAPIALRGS